MKRNYIWISALVGSGAIAAMLPRAATGPETSRPEPAPPPGYSMKPSFSEEFDAPKLDLARWTNVFADRTPDIKHLQKRNLWGNAELQVYFDPAYLGLGIDPFMLNGGILRITAKPLTPEQRTKVVADLATAPRDQQQSSLRNVQYSSGLISTRDGWTQRYGYFEVRARWSGGKGLWPEIWLLPKGGGWPPEIDILEAHGDKPGVAFQSVHSALPPTAVTRTVHYDGNPAEFHRYGAMWLPDRIDYYIDGKKTSSIPAPADMKPPMYVLVNLAVGGNWPGNPDAATVFPATMDVDYVKAWQFEGPPPMPPGAPATP